MAEATPLHYVDIEFDCLPLRSVGRLEIPLDASPKYRQRCERIKQSLSAHGSHNSYFLYNARCQFHLTNNSDLGTLEFAFDGTVLTDDGDRTTLSADLNVKLVRETCDWLTQPIVDWFAESVRHAVRIEFNRYSSAGDLAKTIDRMQALQAQVEQSGGYMGMYL